MPRRKWEVTVLKLSTKKFLITGGAGFIGTAITKRLHDENSQIVILDDFSVGIFENIKSNYEVVKGNVADIGSFHKIHDVDFVLHFGAPSSVVLFNRNPENCITETIIGIRNVFEYSKNNGVRKVIFPSSSSVYGNTPLPQSETTSTTPTNLYGVAKLACENIAKLYSDTVPSVALRIFAGYGPGEAHKREIASVITLFMQNIIANSRPIIFGDGTQSRDFVYIDSIVEAVLKSLENSFTGVVNVGSGESHTFNEIVDLINYFLGKKVHPQYVEKPNQYFEHTLADIRKMKNVLEFSPIGLEDGMKRHLAAKEEILKK
jgi:nucleoside-diphosphate-sugar epimerase